MPEMIHVQLARQIVDTLKTICSHDINYIDIHGRICASTDSSRVNGYHEGGFEAARRGEIVTIEEDDEQKAIRQGINMPIRYHGKTVAVIGITGPPAEVRKYADLAQRITLLLLREHEIDFRDYTNRTQMGHLVRALIENDTVAPDFVAEVLKNAGLTDRAESWRTLLVRIRNSHPSPLSALEAGVRNVVERLGGCLYTFLYPSEYVILARHAGIDRWEKELKSLALRFPEDLKIGIGSARRIYRQDLSYQAARLAIASLAEGENIASFEELRLELLLSSVPEAAGRAFTGKCLTGLDEKDRELLELYYTEDMSLKQTAEKCFLHINTLQYRLKRIHERCGLDPRRFREAAVLYTALQLEKLQKSALEPAG
ncbi:MAG: helix-turn-helix domain-containing protein [Blautia sp.]|nr:helix-turn-helix domain-containing protein [Blautia sp.]